MDNISTFKRAKSKFKQHLLWMLLPFVAMLFMVNTSSKVMADGSPQFRPDTTKASNIMILNTESTYGTFAGYSATDTNRLYIRINDPATEKIYFGIGQRSSSSNWYVRIKNPNGVVIFGPQLLPTAAGTGFIPNHKQAIAGPSVVNPLGYNGFNTNATSGLPGNYYIEFNQGSGTTVANNQELDLGIFDVTVVKTVSGVSTPCTGRLFSKNWSFNTESYANPFYGFFYIYGTDSSVTKVDLNGIKPYKFRVSCNSFGTASTGNSTNDRRSKIGFAVPPELKLFLSDPDNIAYPSGSLQFLNSQVTLSRCVKDSVCINVDLTKKADVTIVIDRNNNNKYDPGTADRKLIFPQVNAGQNCLFWNAKDGLGAYVPVSSLTSVIVSVEAGEVDLPLFDVENHEVGFSMSVIRPGSALFVDSIFYDDVLVGGATNLTGCAFPCHTWTSNPANTDQNTIGNNNTMNSWWFAHKLSSKVNIPMPDYLTTSVGADVAACTNGSNLDSIQLNGSIVYTLSSYTGSKQWTTTGTGFFTPNDSVNNPKYVPSAADIAAGNVALYFAPRNGCSYAKDTLIITVKKNPVLASSIVNVKCFGGATGSINLSVSGSTSPYTYGWSNGSSSQNLTNVVAGTYTVTVTSTNSCSASASGTITQPAAALAMTTSATPVKCFGGNTGSITTSVSGGTTPYTYAWSNGASTANLTNIGAGNYTVTVTDANNCTASTASINVSQPTAALVVSGSATAVSCFGNSTGAINTTVSGGTSPYTYVWSNGATTQNITGVTSGNYTVTVADANLCTSASSTINVSQPTAALNASTGTITTVSCFGASNGAVNLTVSGGTSPYSYVWSNGATTQNLSNVPAGTYSVTVTDAKSCTVEVTGILVTQPAAALANIVTSTSTVSCFGGSNGAIDLTVSGGTTPYSYSWSNGATTQDVTGLSAGNYSVTVTDARGCTATTSGIAITQPAVALSSSVSSSTNVSCFGGANGAINLTVAGGTSPYTYVWSNAATTQNLTGIGAGTYSVTITDAKGCTTQNNAITITQPGAALAASIISSSNVLCFGGNSGAINLSVTGGTSPYSYVWSNGATTQDLTNIVAGTYSVTVTDAKGCTTSVTGITISQPSAALATSATHTNVNCRNGATAAINLTVTGGTTPYSYSWSNGASTEDLNNMAAGNYTVTVTDGNNCTSTSATITITQPTAVLSGSIVTTANVSCNSGANGALDLTVTGGTSPYSYSWSNGSATQDISGLYSGNYVVTITDVNGCTTDATGTVSQPAGSLNSSISVTQNVSCFGGANGAINLTVAGGTTPYTYQWSNGATTQDISGLASGSYTVTVHDANNCINVSTAVVDQPSAALSSSATSVSAVLCYGGNSGAVDLTVTGGTTPYSYNWSSGVTSQDLSNIGAGTYSVTVTDANGCTTQTNAIAVTQPSGALSASVSTSTNVSCFGGGNGSINLTVSGGTSPYTYAWSNGANTQNITGLSAGSYGVTVTDANNCIKTLSALTITQPAAALNATAGSTTNVSCFGGSNGVINLTVTGGTSPYSYAWSNGATTQNITALSAGNYVATITDAKGCTFQTSAISISQPAAALSVNTSATGNVNCFGGSNGSITVATTGGTTPYTYAWSNGAATQNLSGLSAGSYSVTVTDAKGCTDNSGAITITQPSAALASSAAATNVNCFGDATGAINLIVTGGTTPYAYAWSNGATTQNISGLTAGSYTVTVTDAKGCTSTSASVSVTQPSASLASSAIATNVNCFGNATGAVTLTVTGGTTPYAYNWSNGATTQNITAITAGSYTVTVTDAKGCTTTSASVNVTQPSAALTSSASATHVNCFGNSTGAITLTVAGGTIPYSYNWSNGATAQNLSGLVAGTYTVTVTDAKGCTSSQASIGVTQPAAALASLVAATNVNCFGNATGAINLTVTGGTTPYNYAWNNGATSEDLSNLSAGTYTVTVTDAKGCTSSQASISITQPVAALASSATATAVKCFGNSTGAIDLTVAGGTAPYSYNWSNGATTQDLTAIVAGTYTVTVTDAKGCVSSSASINVNQPAAALSSSIASIQEVNCYGSSTGAINLNVNGGSAPYSFLWSTGATTQNLTNVPAGTYSVTITDANACTSTINSITIAQPSSALSASLNVSVNTSCLPLIGNGSIALTVNGGTQPYSYIWSNGSISANISGLLAGSYSVTITDANGCTVSLTGVLSLVPQDFDLSANVTNSGCSGNTGAIDLTVTGNSGPYTYAWSNSATTQDITGLTIGTYSVIVTNANGCTKSLSTYVPPATNAFVYADSLNGFSSPSALCLLGCVNNPSYAVDTAQTNYSLINIPVGVLSTHYLDLAFSKPGKAGDFVGFTVAEDASLLSAQVIGGISITAYNSSGAIVGTHNNFNLLDLVLLQSASNKYLIGFKTAAGNYDIKRLRIAIPSLVSALVDLRVYNGFHSLDATPHPTISLNGPANFCQGGNVVLSVPGNYSSYAWSNGAATSGITVTTSGNYFVTVVDPLTGCSGNSDTVAVVVYPAVVPAISSVNAAGCRGAASGSINISVSGGNSPFSYNWSNGATTQNVNGLLAGNYTVTVTDAHSCSATISAITISQPAASLTATANASNNVSCFGGNNGAISLTVTGGTTAYSYVWSNSATTQNISGLTSGTYIATITDANGCTTSVTQTISQPTAALGATASVSQNVSCYGASNGGITLNVTGGTTPYSYNWSNGATTQNIINLSAGFYSVTVTDAKGCVTNVNAITVTQPAAPLASSAAVIHVACFGNTTGNITLTVTGGTTPYAYAWNNGATTQNLANIASGTYTVTVTDAKGCTVAQSAVQVNQPAAPLGGSASSTNNVSCFGGTNGAINTTVTGGTSPYTYIWSNGATTQNITGISAGTYSVTVTDAHNCIKNITAITISQPAAALTTSVSTGQNVACNGGGNGSINLTVTGGTTPYTYNWSNGATTQDITGLYAGTYGVSVTDANGCTASATGTVSQPAGALATSISASQNVLCFGGTNGSVTLSATGGTSPYTYAWSNGAITQNLSNLSAGNYSVTVTDANGCLSQSSVVISQPSGALNATVSASQNVLCHNQATGSIDVTVTGGTAPFTYVWSNGATTQDLSNIGAGTYSVTVTDANECLYNLSGVVISQPTAALALSNSITAVNCYAGSTGAINLTVTGGTTPYTYNWSNGATTEDISNVTAGAYSVTVTDANGCTAGTTSMQITQPSASLSSSVSATAVGCFGNSTGAVTLTVAGGTAPYSYNWSNGATTQNITGISAGTYSVTVTDANGCTSSQNSITITQPAAALAMTNVVTHAGCFDNSTGAIDVTVTGGTMPYSYNWSNGATSQDLTNIMAGTYSVTVTDANGCTAATASIQVSQPAAALALSNNITAVNCFAGSTGAINITVTGGTTPYTYNWSNGATTEDISNVGAGTYSVTVTDANGCTAGTASMEITQPSASLSSSVSSTAVGCFGNSTGSITLTVTGGTTPYSYNWSNGATTQNITGITAGTYSVTVTDANGCTSSQNSITITQPSAALAMTNTVTNAGCFGNSTGGIDVTVTGGTVPYSYNWSNGATSQDLTNVVAGTYSVTVTDANGCTAATASMQVAEPSAALGASVSASQNVNCFGDATGSISVTATGGTTPYIYDWSNGETTSSISNLTAGNYTVTVTDVNGCSTTINAIAINQPNAALASSVSASQNVNCFGNSTGSVNLTVTGGTTPYSYYWSIGATTQNISGLAAGTYSVTVTDANNCTTTITGITISQPNAALSATSAATNNTSCSGGGNGAVNITVAGGTTPYSYNWSNGATTEDINGLLANTYTVVITDANGCTFSIADSVSQPPSGLYTNIQSTQNINCFGSATGSIDLYATGGVPPYNFNWSTGATTEDIANLASGTYTVTITDGNGCDNTQTVTLSQPQATLNATVNASINILCFADSSGSIDLAVTGGTLPYTYLWNTGASSEDISGLAAGTYNVTITDVYGCSTNSSATLTQPNVVLSSSISSTQSVSCNGGNNGSISLDIQGGTAPYAVLWSNGSVDEDPTGLIAGTYIATITDANGCTTTQTATITQPAATVSATIASQQNINCFGNATGAIDITITGGTSPYSFNWNNGATTEDISGISSGTYTVTVTDAQGCTVDLNATLSQPSAALNANAAATQNVLCFGGNTAIVDLTVNGGTTPYTFSWSNGAITEDINSLAIGSYTVSITDANGCSASASATVTQPSGALSATYVQTASVLCYGGSDGALDATVIGGTAPYTYSWSNGVTTEDISSVSAGNYTLTVTDANGCNFTMNAVVTQPNGPLSPSIASLVPVGCFADSTGTLDLTVNGGTPPYLYYWSNGASTQDLTNIPGGSYFVTVVDSNGCAAQQWAYITSPEGGLFVYPTVTSLNCSSLTSGSIILGATGGTTPYTYAWSNGATTADLLNITAGQYSITVTDSAGCTTDTTIIVNGPTALLDMSGSAKNVGCFGAQTGEISVVATGGLPPYSYVWTNGATTANLMNLAAGSYKVIVSDTYGCSEDSVFLITQPDTGITDIASVTQVTCFGQNNASISVTASGGTAPYSYQWSNGATTASINNLSPGSYTLTIYDASGCGKTEVIDVIQPAAAVQVTGNGTDADCLAGIGGTSTINTTGGTAPYTYLWSTGSTSANLQGVQHGTYQLTVTDANGCIANYEQIINDISVFTAAANGPTEFCTGGVVTLSAMVVPGATYQWYQDGTILTGAINPSFTTPATGAYTVTVSATCGTYTSNAIDVKANSIGNYSVSPNVIICPSLGEKAELNAYGGSWYSWNPGYGLTDSTSSSPIATPQVSTKYTVTISSNEGCSVTAEIMVSVVCDSMFVPTGFSPDGDGTNDTYVIDGLSKYPGNNIFIYNRWGNLVFKKKDYDNSFDGTSNVSGVYLGKQLPNGTYFFILDLNDGKKPQQGYITMKR